ncbi:MAG: AraC family transcriptional regulator [Planctomycetota bacterium]
MRLSGAVLRLAERSLRFEYDAGGVTPQEGYAGTGWRTLPQLVTACISYPSKYEFADGRKGSIRAGETALVPPGLHHCLGKSTRQAGVSRWSHVSYLLFGSLDPFRFVDLPPFVSGPDSERIGALNAGLVEVAGRAGAEGLGLADLARKQALGWSLLETVLKHARERPESARMAAGVERLAGTLEFLNAHFAEALRLDELARRAHLSPSRFHAVFKSVLGVSPQAYWTALRLRRAQEELLRGSRSVKEIAHAVGMRDPFHFSRAFKAAFGQSPQAYRLAVRRSLF